MIQWILVGTYLIIGICLAAKVGRDIYRENKFTVIVGPRFGQKDFLTVAGIVVFWLPAIAWEIVAWIREGRD